MPVVQFPLSPLLIPSVANADISVQQDKVGNPVQPEQLVMTLGNIFTAKLQFEIAIFLSFDLPIPQGSVIAGVRAVMSSTGSAAGSTVLSTGGFIKPQAGARRWQDANAYFEWANDLDVPFAQWNQGVNSDPTVWWNNAPAFSNVAAPTQSVQFDEFSFGENLASTAPGIGLVAQLQSYLDGNEALRGSRVADSIPVCFHVYRPYNSVSDNYQSVYTQDFFIQPFLEVDYQFGDIPVVNITSPATSPISIDEDQTLTLSATAIDTEDGDISAGIQWTSDLDGNLGTGATLPGVSLSIGTHLVGAFSTDSHLNIGSDLTVVTINPIPPVVAISAPPDSSTFTSDDFVNFLATAIDFEDGDLSAAIAWSSDLDGAIGVGASINIDTLSIGVHVITATSTDSRFLIGSDSIGVTIIVANTAPVVAITAPLDATTVDSEALVNFIGTSIDGQEGDISAGIQWTSDLDGLIGTGGSFNTDTLSVGTHVITATSTDIGGLIGTDLIGITVVDANPRTETRELRRPPLSATLSRPSTSTELKRPPDKAGLKRPATRATLKRPPTRATLKRPPVRGTLKTE